MDKKSTFFLYRPFSVTTPDIYIIGLVKKAMDRGGTKRDAIY